MGNARGRMSAVRRALTPAEWARAGGMALAIVSLNVTGWGIFILYVMPHHFDYKGEGGSRGLGVGLGVAVTAWFLGFRHAFDADHISCIDNTTRKLMADGKRPLGTGFFFSFGHSTIVVAVGVGITFAARAVFGAMVNPSSVYETAGGAAGTLLSAGFLYLIAVLNLIVLSGILKVFREMRRGSYDEQELEAQLQARGLMYRFFSRFMRSINHTWQLYFVGLVFGIGFDTATEVVLLAATAYAAIQGLPYFAVLALPFMFSGGMMLFDTLDGCLMNFAYGWAFARPVRKVYYNLVITGLSIGAAFIIGTIEILGMLTTELHLHGTFWSLMANFNINAAGFCIAALFVVVWAVAIAYWRFGHLDRRWAGCESAAQSRARPLNTFVTCEVLAWRGIWTSEERRRIGNVDVGRTQYDGFPYYGRWAWAVARVLVDKHYITLGELIERVAEVRERHPGGDGSLAAQPRRTGDGTAVARNRHHTDAVGKGDPQCFAGQAGDPRFAVGDSVRVRKLPTFFYTRTQEYLRGTPATVAKVTYETLAPEDEAFNREEQRPVWYYIVRFKMTDLWEGYSGLPGDTLQAEVSERWLESVA